MVSQAIRDEQFAGIIKRLAKLFHDKNLVHADSYLTIPRTTEDAFQDIKRKYQRLMVVVKIPEGDRTSEQHRVMMEDIDDLAIYSILFYMWQVVGTREE